MDYLNHDNQADVIEAFNSTSRYLDDLLNIDNPYFEGIVNQIYPPELQFNNANISDTEAPFLDLHLSFANGFISSKIYDKRDDFVDRSELLKVIRKEDKNSKRVPLVVTYSNLLPDIQHITKKHLDVLHRSSKMRDVFKDPPIVAFRRDKNLSDVLVHGKTNKALKSTRLNCKPGCGNCSIISRETVSDFSPEQVYSGLGH